MAAGASPASTSPAREVVDAVEFALEVEERQAAATLPTQRPRPELIPIEPAGGAGFTGEYSLPTRISSTRKWAGRARVGQVDELGPAGAITAPRRPTSGKRDQPLGGEQALG